MRFRKVPIRDVPDGVKEAAEAAILRGNGWRRIVHKRDGVQIGEWAVLLKGRHLKSKNWHGAIWFYGQ